MCSLLNLEWCAYFGHIVQSHHIMCHLCPFLLQALPYKVCGPIVGTSSSTDNSDNFGGWINQELPHQVSNCRA